MQMGQDPVDDEQEQPPEGEADQGRHPGRQAVRLGELHSRDEQRPHAGGDHDPGGEAEHEVEDLPAHGLHEEDERSADRRHEPGEDGGQQGLQYRTEL